METHVQQFILFIKNLNSKPLEKYVGQGNFLFVNMYVINM